MAVVVAVIRRRTRPAPARAAGAASANSCSASPGCGRLQHVVVAAGARRQRVERLARLAALAALDRLALRLGDERVVALLLDLRREPLERRVRRAGTGATSDPSAPGVRRMKRPTTWRKNSSVRALVA